MRGTLRKCKLNRNDNSNGNCKVINGKLEKLNTLNKLYINVACRWRLSAH